MTKSGRKPLSSRYILKEGESSSFAFNPLLAMDKIKDVSIFANSSFY
jgi:hypothetical protein